MILLLQLLLSFCFDINDISSTQRQCFIGQPNNIRFNFVQNTLLHIIFSTLFLVYGYPDETLSVMFDISHKQPCQDWGLYCVSFTCYSEKCLSQIYKALYGDAMVIKYNRYIYAIETYVQFVLLKQKVITLELWNIESSNSSSAITVLLAKTWAVTPLLTDARVFAGCYSSVMQCINLDIQTYSITNWRTLLSLNAETSLTSDKTENFRGMNNC